MIVISDSPTYLLEKVAISKGIKKAILKNFHSEIKENELEKTDFILILIIDSFYKQLGVIGTNFRDLSNRSIEIFAQLESILKILNEHGICIYLSMLPKHFLYNNPNNQYFYEQDSKDLYINHVNYNLMLISMKYSNVLLIKGIENLNPNISKTYFRFSSIYNKSNCEIIFEQIIQHRSKLEIKFKKLIILDLDNTLWKGILGDDLKDGIRMDQSDPIGSIFYKVQKILLEYKSKGFLLALCSKNDEKLALDALFNSPSSQFKIGDIVTHRINWEPKSKNINEICKELNISPKETIFIDDNLHECDEVKNNCPEISIFNVPKDLYSYPYLLSINPLFSYSRSTLEDTKRTDLYKKGIIKKKLFEKTIKSNGSKEDWIRSLKIELKLSLIKKDNKNIDRVIQLFNRSNQFNLAGSKYNKKLFISQLMKKNIFYYFGFASDRIGSEGLISVLGFTSKDSIIEVEDFIMSCRVFGRNIEKSMLRPLLNFAKIEKKSIKFKYINSNRNDYVRNFLKMEYQGYDLSENKISIFNEKYNNLDIKLVNYNSKFFEE